MQTGKKFGRIFVAFPGMGKTTYALSHSGVVDLDFGNFRSAMKVAKENEHILLPAFQRLVSIYVKDGFDVFTNEPSTIPLIKQIGSSIMVVLPRDIPELVMRVRKREQKRHGNLAFVKALAQNGTNWVSDWDKIARKYNISVQYVNYLEEAL